MAINSDMQCFPASGFPILGDVSERISLGTLYKTPLKPAGFMLDILGNNRLLGSLTLGGPLTGVTSISMNGNLSGVGSISLNNGITDSGTNSVWNMTGANASIGTNLARIRRAYFKDLELTNKPTVLGEPVALISDLITYTSSIDLSAYVPYTGANADLDLGTQDLYSKDTYIKDRTVLQTESLRNGALTAVGHQIVTPDFTTSIFKLNAISTPLYPQVGQRVHFSATTFPTGINGTTLYWVVNVVPHVSFQISLTSGGAPVTFTTNGTLVLAGFDWTTEGDCTWDLTNGKAIFAYVSPATTSKFYQHQQGGSNQKAGGLLRGYALASEYQFTYTISNVTGTPQAFIPQNSWVSSAGNLNIDTTAGTHTIYFNTSYTATGNASFEINAILTAGQGFTIADMSVKQVTGGEQTMAGKLSIGTPKGIQQDSKVRIMNTTENRTLDLTRYVYSPVQGNFPTQIYAFESWSYTNSNQQNLYAMQSFIADYRAILNTISTTVDTVVNLSASLTQGGYYQSRFNEGSGLYNQLSDFATYASPNATSTTKKMWGTQSKFAGFTPNVDVVSTLTYTLYGQEVNMVQYAPTITRGALDFTLFGFKVTGGTPVATGTTRMYAFYNDLTGFGTNWNMYNATVNNNLLGFDNSKTYFGTGLDSYIQFTGTQMDIVSDAITATDSMMLRAGTNGLKFNIGATEYGKLLAARWSFNTPINLKGYTVATLPVGAIGDEAYVTDALAPLYLTPVVGGGAITCKVFFNGANWIT